MDDDIAVVCGRIDALAARIVDMGRKRSRDAAQALWECPRGERARAQAEAASRRAMTVAGNLREAGNMLASAVTAVE